MEGILHVLNQIDPEILFIVVLSTYINKYVKFKAKFLVPLTLALMCSAVTAEVISVKIIIRTWFSYAGQSMVLHELWKHYIKKIFKRST